MFTNAILGVKRVFFDKILERAYWTWRNHPAIIVPSMLQSALSLILQSIVTTSIIVLITNDPGNSELARLVAVLLSGGITIILLSPAFWFTNILLTAGVVAAGVLVVIFGGGWIYSSEYGTYFEAWNNDSASISSVVSHGSKRWRQMAWTLFLSNLITWGPAAIGLLIILASATAITSTAGLIGLVTGLSILQPLLAASLIMSIFTTYAYAAVVVDGASGLTAIRQSFRVASHNLGLTLTYAVVRILFQALLLLLATLAKPLGVTMFAAFMAVALGIALTPVLHLTKTAIYYQSGPAVAEMPFQVSQHVWYDVFTRLPRATWAKIRAGLKEMFWYVVGPRNYPFHALSIAAISIGIYLGYHVSISGVASYFLGQGYQPGHGNPDFRQFTGAVPVLGLDIFLNNWLVSIATATSGIGFGAPAFTGILFNGFILGVLAGPQLSPSMTMFYAAILPHGIIEIPSLLISGSVGMKLGYAALRARLRRGPESDEFPWRTLRLAVYVAVGLSPLFLFAGLIEADITPFIMRMFGWTFPA